MGIIDWGAVGFDIILKYMRVACRRYRELQRDDLGGFLEDAEGSIE